MQRYEHVAPEPHLIPLNVLAPDHVSSTSVRTV